MIGETVIVRKPQQFRRSWRDLLATDLYRVVAVSCQPGRCCCASRLVSPQEARYCRSGYPHLC
jgi:hypothetical protein